MFLSAVVPLTACHSVDRRVFLGRECHALFLRRIASADVPLAEMLHRSQANKPFTVSAICMTGRYTGRPSIAKDADYWIRFTSLDGRLTGRLLADVLPNLPDRITLGPAEFTVGTPIVDNGAHPWSGQATPQTIADRWLGAERLPRQITLEAISPTCVRRIRREWVLPTPAVVFDSLLRSWNVFGTPKFDGALTRLVEADVNVDWFRLHTERFRLGEAPIKGWLGKVTYRVFAEDRALRVLLNALADFAVYAGVGYKTTQGLGQVRAVRLADSSSELLQGFVAAQDDAA